MFNYIPEFIINDPSIISAQALDGTTGTDVVLIKRMANIKKSEVQAVYQTLSVAEVNGKYTFEVKNAAPDGTYYRMLLRVNCLERYAAYALTNWREFASPKVVEFVDADSLAAALKVAFDEDTPIAKVSVAGTKVTVEFLEPIFSIDKDNDVYVSVVDHDKNDCNGYCEETEEATTDVVVTEAPAPVVGRGSAKYIQRNLRFPTHENLRYESPNADEMPIPGAYYTQYTIVTKVPRYVGGLSAANQYVESVGRIVLFVKEDTQGTAETTSDGILKALAGGTYTTE